MRRRRKTRVGYRRRPWNWERDCRNERTVCLSPLLEGFQNEVAQGILRLQGIDAEIASQSRRREGINGELYHFLGAGLQHLDDCRLLDPRERPGKQLPNDRIALRFHESFGRDLLDFLALLGVGKDSLIQLLNLLRRGRDGIDRARIFPSGDRFQRND